MSDESTPFWDQVTAGGALRDELDALLGAGEQVPVAEIVALGRRHGYRFTPAELQETLAPAGRELRDDELDAAAGGISLCYQKIVWTESGKKS